MSEVRYVLDPEVVEDWYETTIPEDPKDIDWPNFDDDPVVFMWKLWEMKVHFIDEFELRFNALSNQARDRCHAMLIQASIERPPGQPPRQTKTRDELEAELATLKEELAAVKQERDALKVEKEASNTFASQIQRHNLRRCMEAALRVPNGMAVEAAVDLLLSRHSDDQSDLYRTNVKGAAAAKRGGGGKGDGGSPAKVPDEMVVAQLVSMGYSENAANRAVLAVPNATPDAALEWLIAHMDDPDINDPPVLTPLAADRSGWGAAAGDGSGDSAQLADEEVGILMSIGLERDQAECALVKAATGPAIARRCGNDYATSGSTGPPAAIGFANNLT
ncbi:unnamed protein product [Vitrella brassicaformis CCMP3155]|uniref:UBA domain-containing protein n=1 Tax=Vitrella brassicaformis (strain CCMP3155) TaxID=1169540 RepID=A0A0G4FLP7_VITBC|nr:unnamed protein product [Vitrella brassicaformis CCMP3155]|eukprot:CEM14941.1 unnamed protein product [Vitrella brassicaformis CCMP3155]